MAVLRWDPWGEVMSLQRDVNELFNRSASAGEAAGTRRGAPIVPPIDAFRTEEGLVVRMELPGLSPDEVEISVQEGVLTVSGERAMDADVKEDAWLRRERPVGAFERSFALPEGTSPDGIDASFDRGVLELRIPHPPEQQPRRITINTGGQRDAGGHVGVGQGQPQG